MISHRDGKIVYFCDGCGKGPLSGRDVIELEFHDDAHIRHICQPGSNGSVECAYKADQKHPLPFRCINCVHTGVDPCLHQGSISA